MRIRVPVAMRNRLRKLERIEPHDLPVGVWPQIMGVDEWEVLASHMQDKLAASAYEEAQPVHAPQPMHVPQPVRKAADGLGDLRPRSGVEEYLEAQRRNRERMARLAALQ